MKIKDILNRDLVNLASCESEPIHIPGSIQPHGFLIAVSCDIFEIRYCSGNVHDYIGLSYEQLLGKKYEQIFGTEQSAQLASYTSTLDSRFASPLLIHLDNIECSVTVHIIGSVYVLEFEPKDNNVRDIATIYNQTRQFVGYMEHATSLRMLCQAVADETRAIIGYDRVMIYRFDKDYNGEVFAESRNGSVEPFLGLHYPHTDIPPQARELYLKNLIRVIPDVNYTPVPIYTLEDKSNSDLDMTYSVLRSVSPIHVQYLHNMGVGASLSISLIHEGRLWGLISCHHYGVKTVDSYTRIAAQLQGHFMTSQINVRQIAEEYQVSTQVNNALDKLLAVDLPIARQSFYQIVSHSEILELSNASGVAIMVEGVIYKRGLTPSNIQIQNIINYCNQNARNGSFITSHLSAIAPEAIDFCDTASGLIFHSLDLHQHNCIIWFRQETVKEIKWAGDPGKAIIKEKNHLSPRKSFAAWEQSVKCQSKIWDKPEVTAASNFANALQKHIHTLFISEEETKYRVLNTKLQEAYAELENLNWITSHDLKEPLRKIQIFASKIMETGNIELPEDMVVTLQKIQKSAARMQKLINDVLSYSKVRQFHEPLIDINLGELLENSLSEIQDESAEKGAVIKYDKLPVVHGTAFLIQQLFNNLLRNSLKFSIADRPIHINIKNLGIVQYTPQPDIDIQSFYKITFDDNGIGFDNTFKTSIFKVFTRLHNQSEFGGTGIGLALCKKIIENHGGYITADGIPGEGATFTLYFPVISGNI
jgi:chemotaxis family two-component system sensor kinase Cph1